MWAAADGKVLSGQTLSIVAQSDGAVISKIEFADFGQPMTPTRQGGDCSSWKASPVCTFAAKTNTTAWSVVVRAWVEKQCLGRKSCILDPAKLSDPCLHVDFKTLAVVAQCTHGTGTAVAKNSAPLPLGTHVVKMAELYTGWFEVANMKGAPGSTVHFQVSTNPGTVLEFNMADNYTFGASGWANLRCGSLTTRSSTLPSRASRSRPPWATSQGTG